MARLQFCDYHNMVAILEKGEFNTDFHPMVDFIAASPLRIKTTDEGTHILATVDECQQQDFQILNVSKADASHPTTSSIPLPSLSTVPIPPVTQTDTTPIRQYSRRERIARSSALPIVADEPVSTVRDAQEEDILRLKERVQVLEDRNSVAAKHSRDDAPIKGRSINKGETAAKRISNDSEEIIKYLQEYQDFASELPLEKRIELISDLVKYQENYSKVYKFQSQQRRPMTKKQKREYYMAMIRNNLGWKVKDFKEEAPEMEKSTEEITKKKMKEMMQLVPIEDVYVQALQVKHPIIDWKVYTEGQRSY
nr:hypothetical protein [Tanacetum cinerariifolium]